MAEDKAQERALTDRLVAYADACVAVAFVGMSGLCLAVADPDTRADIARAADWVIVSNLLLGGLLSYLIHVFRGWEFELRDSVTRSAAAERVSRNLHWGRLGVVWVSVAQSVGVMFAIR
jgi:hypothetical protein